MFLALVLVLVTASAAAQSRFAAAGVDDRVVESFISELQRAVARDDRQAVAAMIQYPVRIVAEGLRLAVPDAADLIERYEIIFSPDLKQFIARTRVSHDVTASGHEIAIGPNVILMKPFGGTLKITSISASLGSSTVADTPTTAMPAPNRRATRAAAREPKRIMIRGGQKSTRLSGLLGPGQSDAYVIWAEQGRLLEVRIEGVPQRTIVARVRDSKTGTPLDARAREGTRVWSGRVPAAAHYLIDVVCLQRGSAELLYLMVVTLR